MRRSQTCQALDRAASTEAPKWAQIAMVRAQQGLGVLRSAEQAAAGMRCRQSSPLGPCQPGQGVGAVSEASKEAFGGTQTGTAQMVDTLSSRCVEQQDSGGQGGHWECHRNEAGRVGGVAWQPQGWR